MKKNDLVTVTIEDMDVRGEGIGKADGFPLFIKDAIIGDVVEARIMKVKKSFGYARLIKVLTPSPDRILPPCPVARQCGGCQIMAMNYPAQLAFKQNKVRNALARIGGFSPEFIDEIMEPICGMEEPFRYRNKAQFPIGRDKDGNLIAGFYAGRTHSIIPCEDCLLGVRQNKEILDLILDHMREFGIEPYDEETHSGLVRHVLIRYGFRTGELMVCLVLNGRKVPAKDQLCEKLIKIPGMTSITLNVNTEKTNVILGREIILLAGQDYITDYIGDAKYQISPLSFYQVNPVQTEKLYGTALSYAGLTGGETVWDLYCGIGTISLFLAQKAGTVHGVEIVPEAIEDARKNAALNESWNTVFSVGKAEEVLPEYYERYAREHSGDTAHADVIVVDPPRKGCERSVLETMIGMAPEKIVYVSCDPATLARDLKILCEGGYLLERVKATDMFPMTAHIETIVLLQKLNS